VVVIVVVVVVVIAVVIDSEFVTSVFKIGKNWPILRNF